MAESPVALVLVGTNHRHAPIGVREELAARTHGRDLIEAMAAEDPVLEAVGLSTCNRCEIAMVRNDWPSSFRPITSPAWPLLPEVM